MIVLSIVLAPLAMLPNARADLVSCSVSVTICWDSNSIGGNWEDASKWNLGRVPTASDDIAIIGCCYQVTLSSVQTVHSLYMGFGPSLLCTSSCTLTILAHTPGWSSDIASSDIINIAGNVVNHAQFVVANGGTINIQAGGTFVNHNLLTFSPGGVTNDGVFDEKCGASVAGTVGGTVVTESPCPTQVSIASGSPVTGTASFQSELGAYTSETATAVSSISPAPPSGLTFPDGVFSFTLSGLRVGQVVTVVIALPSALPAGTFSYWKFHGGTWTQLPASKATLDSTRTIITLTLTDGASPDDADGVANGVIVDPGGPAVPPSVQPAVHPLNVGGEMFPLNLAQVLSPWVAAILALTVVVIETLVIRKKKSRGA